MELILGSGSPRRREILGYFTLPFIQKSPHFDEDAVPFEGDPSRYVCNLSEGKSFALQKDNPTDLILTADTTVYFNGEIYNKPKDAEEAFSMLARLVGNWHEVYTAVTLSKGDERYTSYEKTRVLMNSLNSHQIREYQKRCHTIDKAAGYAIQREGSIIVDRIEGCYYNVMGLPINTVRSLLAHFDISLWDYLT